ncbi:MAG: hypothetical protein H7833_01165 [Magnetococcus sp. DMHC-1]
MPTEFSVELEISGILCQEFIRILNNISECYIISFFDGGVTVSECLNGGDLSNRPLNEEIMDFLVGLNCIKDKIHKYKSCLRVGVFYLLNETVVCPA